ncbi:unnamed protein product [Alopecurus aequalis]
MEKYTERLHALGLVALFLLVSFAVHAQCRSMEGVYYSEKIDLSHGLCKVVRNCGDNKCNCCTLVSGLETMRCWDTMDRCMAACGTSPPSDVMAAEATTLSRSALPSN